MDPISNSTPNPIPNQNLNSVPTPGPVPPVLPKPIGQQPPVAPTSPQPGPVVPPAPVAQQPTVVQSVASPEEMVNSASPVPPAPVNPVINPAAQATPPVNPVFNPTTPLTMPEPAAAPDPVEQELKAPLKAADPVPGSIGSAISMPGQGFNQTQSPNSVSFSDPAMEAGATSNMQQPMAPAQNKPVSGIAKMFNAKVKMDKKTLILLCVIAGIVVVALVIVLIMQLNGMI